jgi:hypothetical protein
MGGGCVKWNGLSGLYRQRSCGTYGQAEASSVAQLFAEDAGFAINKLNGSFGARCHA